MNALATICLLPRFTKAVPSPLVAIVEMTVIGQAVRDRRIDLLVMGAYGHRPIRQFILGSTTTTMVRTCLVPVLMFR